MPAKIILPAHLRPTETRCIICQCTDSSRCETVDGERCSWVFQDRANNQGICDACFVPLIQMLFHMDRGAPEHFTSLISDPALIRRQRLNELARQARRTVGRDSVEPPSNCEATNG